MTTALAPEGNGAPVMISNTFPRLDFNSGCPPGAGLANDCKNVLEYLEDLQTERRNPSRIALSKGGESASAENIFAENAVASTRKAERTRRASDRADPFGWPRT